MSREAVERLRNCAREIEQHIGHDHVIDDEWFHDWRNVIMETADIFERQNNRLYKVLMKLEMAKLGA